jgi:AraC-like DNA-binding protein
MYGRLFCHPAVVRLLRLLEHPSKLDLTVEQAAREVNASTSLLQHALKKAGMKYSHLVAERKATIARRQLAEHPEESIEVVAERCNYDTRTMRRHFQKVFGESPASIRRQFN